MAKQIFWGAIAFLIFVAIGVALVSTFSSPKTTVVTPPDRQNQFCSILENARAEYRALMSQWSKADKEQNGILKTQLSEKMTSVYLKRNEAIFQFIRPADFKFENWIFLIEKVGTPFNNSIRVDLHPGCSPTTTFHASIPNKPEHIGMLARLKHGDRIVLSGVFLERNGIFIVKGKTNTFSKESSLGQPKSSEDFELSLTENGSMGEPEYSIIVTILK